MTPAAEFKPTQRTIRRSVEIEGAGVHGGQSVRLRLEPAPADSGILFHRIDLPGSAPIPARLESVRTGGVQRMSVLQGASTNGAQAPVVGMVEHLLAACAGLGVTNLNVSLDSAECPILDGSACEYARLLHDAGLEDQAVPARVYRLSRPVCLLKEGAEIIAIPALRPRYTFFGEFRHAGIADQQVTFDPQSDDFMKEIAPARTFCFWEEVKGLFDSGLIRGGSLENAIVLRDGRPMNGEYRMENELARHKLLDLMGDLAVLGRPLCAMVSARRTGHALHHEFNRLLAPELIDG